MREKVRDKIGRKSNVFLVIVILSIFLASTAKSETSITNSGSTLDENLVAEYRFDTGAGDTAYDTTGNNDGSFGGDWVSGINGKAASFDGSSSARSSLNVDASELTLSFWLKETENINDWNDYISIEGNNARITPEPYNGNMHMIIRKDGNNYDAPKVNLGEGWNHYFVVVSSSQGFRKTYKNGELIGTNNNWPGFTASDISIGSGTTSEIDEIQVYSQALDSSQIKSIHNSGSWEVKTPSKQSDPSKVLDLNFQHVQNGEVLDTSGNNNHGSIGNGARQVGSAGCKVGRCFSFDGTNGELIIQDDESRDYGKENFAISFWFKADTLESGAHRFHMKRDAYQDHELSFYHSGSSLIFRTLNSVNGGPDVIASEDGLQPDKFYHVVGTRDGDTLELYLNGERVATASGLANITSSDDTYIGSKKSSQYFDGKIDNFKAYDRHLSDREIWKIYTEERDRSVDQGMAGPVAHYPMKTESSPVVDVAGGNNGALDAIGEAGTFNTSDGNWQTVHFKKEYTDPVIVGTTNTHNGQSAIYFETRNVQSNKAEMRLCESEGGNNDGCDTHGTEKGGYIVVDAASTDQVSGIEAGTFTTSSTSVSFSNGFTNTPVVFTQVMTDNSEGEVVSWVTSKDNESFSAKICDQSSTDGCDSPDEEFGWIAVEPGNEPFAQSLEAEQLANEVGSSNWASTTFDAGFSENPVGVFSVQNNDGGQDPKVDEIRNVDSNGMEMRFCELQTGDTCDGHADMAYAYLAAEKGLLTPQTSSSPKYVDTERGKALEFDGNDDYVSVDGVGISTDQPRTISGWVKTSNLDQTGWTNVFGFAGGSTNDEFFDIQVQGSDSRYVLHVYGTEWPINDIDSGWHHIAASYTGNRVMAFYDGEKVIDSSYSSLNAIDNFQIGKRADNSNYFDGQIDDVSIYPYALNQSQVTQVMNDGAVNIG